MGRIIDAKTFPHPIIKLDAKNIADALIPSDWHKAEHRYPNPVADWRWKHAIACTIEITGKAIMSWNGALWKRARIVWVGDGEPNTESGCAIKVDGSGEPMTLQRHEIY